MPPTPPHLPTPRRPAHLALSFAAPHLSLAAPFTVQVLLEVTALKLAFYLLQAQGGSAPALDLISYSGYKFLGAVLVLVLKTTLGAYVGTAAILLCGANIGTFMARTLRQCFVQDASFTGLDSHSMGSPGRSTEKWKRQNYALLSVALLQPLFFWYLSRV